MTTGRTVLTSGYCALDVVCLGDSVSHLAGGTAANVAANLSYLEWEAGFVGRLGHDAPARRIVRDLSRDGVELGLVERDPGVATPVVLHRVAPPRHEFSFSCPECERRLPKHRAITAEHLDRRVVPLIGGDRRPSVFVFDRASAAAVALARTLREAGSLIVFEPSSRGDAVRTAAAAAVAHVVKVSGERLGGLHSGLLAPRAGQWQVATASAAGLRFRRGGGAWKTIPSFVVTDVDGAGAGDWLTAAFLDAVGGLDLLEAAPADVSAALRRSQALAALSCGYVGARVLSQVPLNEVRALEATLVSGAEVRVPPARRVRRSRARNVCHLCLGPTTADSDAVEPLSS